MIDIEIKIQDLSGFTCDNKDCKHNPEYSDNIIGDVFYIKKNTVVAIISLSDYENGPYNLYCRDCIDDVYNQIKSKLDSKLWAFQ